MRSLIELDSGAKIVTEYDGDLTTVTLHSKEGFRARANAKRNPVDKYNRRIGYQLAYHRALARLSPKLVKHYSRIADAT